MHATEELRTTSPEPQEVADIQCLVESPSPVRSPSPELMHAPSRRFQNVLDIPEILDDLGDLDRNNLVLDWATKECMHVYHAYDDSSTDQARCAQRAQRVRRHMIWVAQPQKRDLDIYEHGDELFQPMKPNKDVVVATCMGDKNVLEGLTIKLGATGCLVFDDSNESTELRDTVIQGKFT